MKIMGVIQYQSTFRDIVQSFITFSVLFIHLSITRRVLDLRFDLSVGLTITSKVISKTILVINEFKFGGRWGQFVLGDCIWIGWKVGLVLRRLLVIIRGLVSLMICVMRNLVHLLLIVVLVSIFGFKFLLFKLE